MPRLLVSLVFLVLALFGCAQAPPAGARDRDLIYLKSGGAAFTMDAFRPAKPNGIAVIWVVSGGWFSDHSGINEGFAKPLTDAGITVFEVVHGSQPRYKIDEIQRQITRAVRFVRSKAAAYGFSPDRIGITGGSAGGHLSLMAAGTGDAGNPNSPDPIERVSSRVNSVAAFFPPVDFLNFGSSNAVPVNAPGMAPFRGAFGVDPAAGPTVVNDYLRKVSPIYTVTPAFPPTLLIHGDADPLVPIQQSRLFADKLTAVKVKNKLIVVPKAGHSGPAFLPYFADVTSWFLETLPPKR